MTRFYLCDVIGAGTRADPFRPALSDAIQAAGLSVSWGGDDGRVDERTPGGWMLAWADVTDAEHAALAAHAGVTWIPFETGQGVPLGPDALIGEVAAARRQQIRTALEAHHVPIDDLTLADPLRRVIGRIIRRNRVRRGLALRYADWALADSQDLSESLDSLVGALPAAKRAALAERLGRLGFDLSVVQPGDTVRAALQTLAVQDVAWLANQWD